jgi:hypothetical protein
MERTEWQILLRRYWPAAFLDSRLSQGIDSLKREYPDLPPSDESPVFVFSAGWRTGSTLLQRLLNSHPEVMVWGEAYEDAFLFYHLAEPLSVFTKGEPDLQLLPQGIDLEHVGADFIREQLTREFIPTLSPPVADLQGAHRAFLETLFKTRAVALGRRIWGVKMVRGTGAVAKYLRWLYPAAKLLYIFRNPYAAFRSYINQTEQGRHHWHIYYPSHPVEGIEAFMVHWRHCVETFLASHRELNAFLVPYELLVHGGILAPMQSYLGLELDPGVLGVRADFAGRGGRARELTASERERIALIGGEVATRFGYAPT